MVRQSPRSRPEVQDRQNIAGLRRAPKVALADAALDVSDGRTTLVMACELPGSPTAVWAMLTQPSLLVLWAPFTADRDLSRIGRATLTMLDTGSTPAPEIASVVFVANEPHELEFGWGDDTVSWNVGPSSTGGSWLILRQTLAHPTMASANAAGWHLCLGVADSVLDGLPTPAIRGTVAMEHGWSDLNRRYAAKLDVVPTQLPGMRG